MARFNNISIKPLEKLLRRHFKNSFYYVVLGYRVLRSSGLQRQNHKKIFQCQITSDIKVA